MLRAESDELATVRTELTGGKRFYAVATHLDLYDPEARPAHPHALLGSTHAAIQENCPLRARHHMALWP